MQIDLGLAEASTARGSLRVAAVTAMLMLAFVLVGCGGASGSAATGAEPGDGQKIFSDAGCGGCHTLSAADSSGSAGPNLDDVKPSTEEVAAKVEAGGGGMPAFSGDLTEEQITAVAKFVSESAGK